MQKFSNFGSKPSFIANCAKDRFWSKTQFHNSPIQIGGFARDFKR